MPRSAEWALLSSHGRALVHIANHPDATLAQIAAAIGVTERRAHGVVTDLAAEGYLLITRVGRRNHYEIDPVRHFRHESMAHVEVGALLDALG